MYTLSIRRNFIARHYLIGGDWGAENLPNSHRYVVELRLRGHDLNEHGYLVDIVDVERHLDALISGYEEKMLNDLPEFKGLNPSLENFVRLICIEIDQRLSAQRLSRIEVVLWENELAWAAFDRERPGQI